MHRDGGEVGIQVQPQPARLKRNARQVWDMSPVLSNLTVVAKQVAILFALMGAGYGCNKAKLFGETAVKGMTELLVMIVAPCLIVHSFQRPYDPAMLAGLGFAFVISVAVHAVGIFCGHLLRGGAEDSRRTMRFAILFSNAGFMGIPLEQAVLGTEGVFYGAVYVAVFNMICWSYGVMMMGGGRSAMSLKGILANPGLLGVAAALPIFFFSVRLPEVVGEPVKMLADINTPLAMVIIGYYLAEADFSAVAGNVRAWAVILLRLVAIPSVVLAALWLLARTVDMPPKMMEAMVVAASAPVAALTTAFSVKYGRDVPLSVGLVALSTLLSVVTMPPLVALAMTAFS